MGPDPHTTVLYVLSTIAQTCAALAAFVGAVGLYRLQSLRDLHAQSEGILRGLLAGNILSPEDATRKTTEDVERIARLNLTGQTPAAAAVSENLRKVLAQRDGFPSRFSRTTKALLFFEAWNLVVIGVVLIGFTFVSLLATSPKLTGGLLVVIALGTVVVTLRSVMVWTKS